MYPCYKVRYKGSGEEYSIDTGSDLSILEPGITNMNIRDTNLRHNVVTGETIEVKAGRRFHWVKWPEVRPHDFRSSATYVSSWAARH